MGSSQYSGFSSHVQNQIFQMSQDQHGRGGGGGGGGRSRTSRGQHHNLQSYDQPFAGIINSTGSMNQASSYTWNPQNAALPEMDGFPPLGSFQTPMSTRGRIHPGPQQPDQSTARDFFDRARGGNYRGRARRRPNYSTYSGTAHAQNSTYTMGSDYRHAPSNRNNRNYSPAMNHHFSTADQQRAFRQRVMEQSDYLNYIAQQNLKNFLSKEEQTEKHIFRKELEMIAKTALSQTVLSNESSKQTDIRLECYGSLANSFGVAGCDMDLMLTICSISGKYDPISEEAKRFLEKAILDCGYGARLLINTRVPILRVCQKPGAELLQNLRDYRQKWEESLVKDKEPTPVDKRFPPLPNLTAEQELTAAAALLNLDDMASEIALPPSPTLEQAKVEYLGDCGIQCDINFTNHVALQNTRLLWTYGQCDLRVRQMGIFVKNWAKARDINTPYRGTLSSYGYVLMVLHYVMNIANPPLIPNLQQRAKDEDFWYKKPVELFEGFDARFTQDIQQVQQAMSELPKNHESLGALLRGFFCYYATTQGFNWTQDIISIRTPGGIIPKRVKGWTEAKWSVQKQNVRLRYLCAIEDPFEIEHNVARTVGHSGIVAIRDEFRRAWRIIEGVYQDPQTKCWVWSTRENTSGGSGDELIEKVENRGDLLKKDHEERKQKLRQMKQELEAQEESLRRRTLENDNTAQEDLHGETSNGMCKEVGLQVATSPPIVYESTLRLISDPQYQHSRMRTMQVQDYPKRQQRQEVNDVQELSDTTSASSVSADTHLVYSSRTDSRTYDANHQIRCSSCSSSRSSGHSRHKSSSCRNSFKDADARVVGYCSASKAASSPVGRVIAWNGQSKGGRWLLWRDQLIWDGSWVNPMYGVEAALNARFPYDPTMTREQLRVKNVMLGKFYLHTLHPRMSKEDSSRLENSVEIIASHASEIQQTATDMQKESTKKTRGTGLELRSDLADENLFDSIQPAAVDDKPTETAVSVPRISEVTPPPSLAITEHHQILEGNSKYPSRSARMDLSSLGEHRVAFFTRNEESEERSPLVKYKNLEIKRLSSETAYDRVSMPSRKDSAVDRSWNVTHRQRSISPIFKADYGDDVRLLYVSGNEGECDKDEGLSDIEETNTIASTFPILLTQLGRLSVRRRLEEDSSILPVPTQSGFQIDPRQLADIKIIEAGGNPCAMQGYEFAWESSERSWAG